MWLIKSYELHSFFEVNLRTLALDKASHKNESKQIIDNNVLISVENRSQI